MHVPALARPSHVPALVTLPHTAALFYSQQDTSYFHKT